LDPKPILLRLAEHQRNRPQRVLGEVRPIIIGLASLLLVGLVAVLDFLTGVQLSLALLYLIPIGVAAWYGNRPIGLLVAAIAGLAWVANELLEYHPDQAWMLYWNISIRVTLFLIVAYLLSSLRHRLQEVSLQANTDALTGLFNRRFLYERFREETIRAHRYRHPVTLISFDVDEFKKINDERGHVFGDQVLRGVGEVLHEHIRQTDVPARIGGDEFAILLIETGADEGREVAEKLQRTLRARMTELGPNITFSIGVVTFPVPPQDIDQMFRLTDVQLYRAKHLGKDMLAIHVATEQEFTVH